VDGGYHSNHYSPADTRLIVQDFLKKYKDKYGKAPDALAVLAYDATTILLQSIKDAGTTDTTKVRDKMAAIKIETVSGTITFGKDIGDPIKSLAINHVTGGKIEFVKFFAP
jgi:branched-chain amino acid transport system substrate-binding protein